MLHVVICELYRTPLPLPRPSLLAELAVFMNLTVKHIVGTTGPLICVGDKTTCSVSVESQPIAAETALISARAKTDGLGLEVHMHTTALTLGCVFLKLI